MDLRNTQPKPPKKIPKGEVALFWDYENVPVPNKGGMSFLQALRNFFREHPVECAKIYAHEEIIPAEILKEIRKIGPFRVNWVTGAGENAADKVMMQSARDMIRIRPTIPIIVLITGDGDFQEILGEFGASGGRTILICGRQNYNYRLFKNSPHVFSTHFLSNHPGDWWELPRLKPVPIIQKHYPLRFCPKCETHLIVRGIQGGYQYWCTSCQYLSKKIKHSNKMLGEETKDPKRKFIGL